MIGLGLHGFIHCITSLKYLRTFSSLSFWLKINSPLKLNNSNPMVEEFKSNQFQSFLTMNGILYIKSCPYTSQHNGLAERKLRHIMETGLTLLAHSHLSNRYWVDVFLTAVYVFNRLSTPILNHQTPY
jgi:hypothetical protein